MNERNYWCHGSSFNELLDLERFVCHDNIKIEKFTNGKSL